MALHDLHEVFSTLDFALMTWMHHYTKNPPIIADYTEQYQNGV